MLSLADSQRWAVRPVAMTENPRHASRRATSSPMPEVAPVMTTVFIFFPPLSGCMAKPAPGMPESKASRGGHGKRHAKNCQRRKDA